MKHQLSPIPEIKVKERKSETWMWEQGFLGSSSTCLYLLWMHERLWQTFIWDVYLVDRNELWCLSLHKLNTWVENIGMRGKEQKQKGESNPWDPKTSVVQNFQNLFSKSAEMNHERFYININCKDRNSNGSWYQE